MIEPEQVDRKLQAYNKEVVQQLMPAWCANLGENAPIARQAKGISDMNTKSMVCVREDGMAVVRPSSAIVIGAGPSLAKADLELLKQFRGDILVCNKSYKRLVDMNIVPEWVLLLDADAMSVTQFRWMEETPPLVTPNFFVSTVAYPGTVKLIADKTLERGKLYMFNPIVRGGENSMSKAWEWITFKESFEHGGSVGTCAFDLAMFLKYSTIGLLGFDFIEQKNREWTFEESTQREVFWYPDTDEYVHVPLNFLCYAQYMLQKVRAYQNENRRVVNLSDSPMMRHSPVVEQQSLRDFIAWQ